MTGANVPYFRPPITDDDVEAVAAAVRSGWLTSGPQVKRFEQEFAAAVGAKHALAVNSCTAALHLAVEALHLRADQVVLTPTMTFAATAEVVRYQGAWPLLVDCDPVTAHLDFADAERKLADFRAGRLPGKLPADAEVVGIIPVHVAGLMMDVAKVKAFATKHRLWTVEDSAHSFPAAWRCSAGHAWQRCGENTSMIGCFSFYANKTITTGEGGMAVTDDDDLAGRMRLMALHGLSHDAWGRYAGGPWDYRIVAPGFKYNMTDMAAALGLRQLSRAHELRDAREALAMRYLEALADVEWIELPPVNADRVHAWHLFPIRLRLDRLRADRNQILDELKKEGVGCSVHWRPLHLHPYYEEFGWTRAHLPEASALWERLISLPMFPGMREDEFQHVVRTVSAVCARHGR
ncbi:MAG TPA: DegT/DnrJ/EryC1/StrS aminotransferase family protein [Candidatus Eisenbacteria bacterium]|nr:DegT/DnrJ/EryC1/StrS aminotransferase family protein [Candidatus Eisenbacteria bacterium]